MLVSAIEAESILNGVKKFLLIPSDPDLNVKEIRAINDEGYVAIVGLEVGTLDHWLHDKAVLQDYGFAQPHELTDYLRRKHGKLKDDQQIWARVELVRVSDWKDLDPKEIKKGLFGLLFRMKTENRM